MKLFSILVGLPLLVADAASGYAYPQKCTGICTNAHDPSIIQNKDGKYFRFSTGGNISVHEAPYLTGPWKYIGAALPSGSIINLKGRFDLWAPDVQKVGDMYYLYYTVITMGSQNSAIGLARSKTMIAGTWADAGSVQITSDSSRPYNAIDPHLFKDGSQYYLNFRSYWQGLYQAKVKSDPLMPTLILAGAPRRRVNNTWHGEATSAGSSQIPRSAPARGGLPPEGLHMRLRLT